MSLPEQIGRLRRIERLGVGGFASVWRYYDDDLESDVAVKALADNWSQRSDIRERFLAEARILRKADSDHVVKVFDIGETTDGTPYFVMSYADSGTVADLILDGPVEADLAMALTRQAGAGIEVLHRQGVIHRDIKPQNLLLKSCPEGGFTLLVADLGVAKLAANASGLTQVVGTPEYMAPEQAKGQPLDHRADVHSLGAVAYVMLTGRPVRGSSISCLLQATLPAAPSRLAPVPGHLDAPILRALEPDPRNRWPDVASFVAAIDPEARQIKDRRASGSRTVTVLLFLLVLVAAFAVSFVVTAQFR